LKQKKGSGPGKVANGLTGPEQRNQGVKGTPENQERLFEEPETLPTKTPPQKEKIGFLAMYRRGAGGKNPKESQTP